MKTIRIFLLILIIIGLGLLFTQKYWLSSLTDMIISYEKQDYVLETKIEYDKNVSTIEISKNITTEQLAIKGIDGSECRENSKYFIVGKGMLNGDVGTDFIVKYKEKENQTFQCEYKVGTNDFEVKNEEAEWFLAIQKNFLILDSGTGPGPRGLVIYNLDTRKKIFKDNYEDITPLIFDNNSITYWSPTDQKPTIENCPKINSEEYFFGAVIESYIRLDLSNFKKTDLGKYYCRANQ